MLAMPPEDFVRDILAEKLCAQYVSVGYNFTFGKDGAGSAMMLKKLGEKYGIRVDVADNITFCAQNVSSSLLREYIALGEIEKANVLMTEPYAVCGRVCEGKHLGASWGIATANVELSDKLLIPKRGVYRTKTTIGDREYKSVTNIGVNPTVEHAKPRSETHIIDFSGDLYGKNIEVAFIEMMRPEIRFDSPDELIRQIKKDIEYVKNKY